MSQSHATAHAPHASDSAEDIPWLFLDARVYRRLGMVTIRHAGGITRANHVIVSNYGIFVIEENTETGTFQANPGLNWTQYRDEQSVEIPNPIRQVSNQVQALQDALELPSSHFRPAVFFSSGHVYLKGEVPDNVIAEGFTDYVKSFKKVVLSDAQVEELVTQLTQSRPTARSEHRAASHPGGKGSAKPAPGKATSSRPVAAPSQGKTVLYGLTALVLGALIMSVVVSWLT